MSMPLGKIVGRYSTVVKDNPDAADYRKIASVMTSRGHKMNFSSARNVFLSGMERLADAILAKTGESASQESVALMARNPNFQSYIMDVIDELNRNKHQA